MPAIFSVYAFKGYNNTFNSTGEKYERWQSMLSTLLLLTFSTELFQKNKNKLKNTKALHWQNSTADEIRVKIKLFKVIKNLLFLFFK